MRHTAALHGFAMGIDETHSWAIDFQPAMVSLRDETVCSIPKAVQARTVLGSTSVLSPMASFRTQSVQPHHMKASRDDCGGLAGSSNNGPFTEPIGSFEDER